MGSITHSVEHSHELGPGRTLGAFARSYQIPISKRNLFAGVMIGYAINNVLPRVGEFVRPYIVGKREGISRTSVFGTVIVERILDFMSFFFIVCVVLFLYPRSLDPFVNQPDAVRPLFLIGSIAALAIFVLLFFKAEAFFRFLAKMLFFIPHKHKEKVEIVLDKFYTGFAVAKLRDKFGVILFQSFLSIVSPLSAAVG